MDWPLELTGVTRTIASRPKQAAVRLNAECLAPIIPPAPAAGQTARSCSRDSVTPQSWSGVPYPLIPFDNLEDHVGHGLTLAEIPLMRCLDGDVDEVALASLDAARVLQTR